MLNKCASRTPQAGGVYSQAIGEMTAGSWRQIPQPMLGISPRRCSSGMQVPEIVLLKDLLSRLIVDSAASPNLRHELVLDAVVVAVRRRRPRVTVIHSDQGRQYGSVARRRFCRANRLEPSMSRRGNC